MSKEHDEARGLECPLTVNEAIVFGSIPKGCRFPAFETLGLECPKVVVQLIRLLVHGEQITRRAMVRRCKTQECTGNHKRGVWMECLGELMPPFPWCAGCPGFPGDFTGGTIGSTARRCSGTMTIPPVQ